MPTLTPDFNDLTERQQHILSFVQGFSESRGYPPSMREIGEHFGIRSTNGVSDHLRALERKGFLQRSGHLSRSLTVVRQSADAEPTYPDIQRAGADSERAGADVERVLQRGVVEPELAGPPLPPNVVALRPPPGRPGHFDRTSGGRPAQFDRAFGGRLVRRGDGASAASMRAEHSALVPVLGKVAAGQPLLAVEDAEETLVVDQFLLGGPGEVFALRVVGESMIDAGILPGDYLFVRKRDTARAGEIVVAMIDGEATVKRYFPEGDRIRLQPENRTMAPIYVRRGDAAACQLVGAVVGVYRRM